MEIWETIGKEGLRPAFHGSGLILGRVEGKGREKGRKGKGREKGKQGKGEGNQDQHFVAYRVWWEGQGRGEGGGQ